MRKIRGKNGSKSILDKWNNIQIARRKIEHSVLRRAISSTRPWAPNKKGIASCIFIPILPINLKNIFKNTVVIWMSNSI